MVVRIAEKEIDTGKAVFTKGAYNRFNFRTTPQMAEYEGPYINAEDIGSVFVYLKKKFKLGGEKNICFYRGKAHEFFDTNPTGLKWVQLSPDRAINEVKEPHKAGLVGLKLSIHDETQNGTIDWANLKQSWGARLKKRPNNFKVRAYVF